MEADNIQQRAWNYLEDQKDNDFGADIENNDEGHSSSDDMEQVTGDDVESIRTYHTDSSESIHSSDRDFVEQGSDSAGDDEYLDSGSESTDNDEQDEVDDHSEVDPDDCGIGILGISQPIGNPLQSQLNKR